MSKECLLIIDIQPEYKNYCSYILKESLEKIKKTKKDIIFLFVGSVLLENSSIENLIEFLKEEGLKDNTINRINFIEKDYGFYRGWMDNGISDETIIKTINHMKENKLYDSRDIECEDFISYLEEHADTCDNIFHPSISDERNLLQYENYELIGGGANECLKEIALFLLANEKNITLNHDLIYGGYCDLDINLNKNKLKKRKNTQ